MCCLQITKTESCACTQARSLIGSTLQTALHESVEPKFRLLHARCDIHAQFGSPKHGTIISKIEENFESRPQEPEREAVFTKLLVKMLAVRLIDWWSEAS